jgi:hypothetical protein
MRSDGINQLRSNTVTLKYCRSQWPRGLGRGSAAARLLGLRVRIPPRAWMSDSCECCVLSGSGLCNGLITRPEESYRQWCVWVWSLSLDNEEVLAHSGLSSHREKVIKYYLCESVFLPLLSSTQSACAVFYRHLWPVWLCHIFSLYLINRAISENLYWIQNSYFDLLYNFRLKHF